MCADCVSWLVYAEMQNDDIVTYMNSTVVVPPAPLKNGGSPAFWPGIGAQALLFVSLVPNSPLT